MPALKQLSNEVQQAFGFLSERGFRLTAETYSGGDSYRDGFWLKYIRGDTECRIEYTDMEFTVTLGGKIVFGTEQHPKFSGNMFSREHLLVCLPHLSEVVNSELTSRYDNAA